MAKRRRGFETAADMVRSLGIVMLVVVAVWFFARPPHSDEKSIRVVDPTDDIRAFSADFPGTPVPLTPPGWQVTVSTYDSESGLLRIGWVTSSDHYAEYAATAHPTERFLPEITGDAPKGDALTLGTASWTQYRKDGALSLVHVFGATTVVLGTVRDTATLDELGVLATRLAA